MASTVPRWSSRATCHTRTAVTPKTRIARTHSRASPRTTRRRTRLPRGAGRASVICRRCSSRVAATGRQGCPPGLEACDRHPERRAAHVVEADLVAEVHGVGVAAVLAADAELEV